MTETINAHHGGISVDDNPGGAVVFKLRFGQLMGEQNKQPLPQPRPGE